MTEQNRRKLFLEWNEDDDEDDNDSTPKTAVYHGESVTFTARVVHDFCTR